MRLVCIRLSLKRYRRMHVMQVTLISSNRLQFEQRIGAFGPQIVLFAEDAGRFRANACELAHVAEMATHADGQENSFGTERLENAMHHA